MKYLALLGALLVICVLLTRQSPVSGVQQSVAEADAVAPPTSVVPAPSPTAGAALKQPIDRTKAVLERVRERNGDGEF